MKGFEVRLVAGVGSTDGSAGSGSQIYDTDNMQCSSLTTTIDPNDPLNTSNPNNVTLPGCPQLVNELKSAFPGWLQEAEHLDMAEVVIAPWIQYNGSDPVTMALFWYDPTNPTVPKTDGTGYLEPRTYNVKVTNADTESYSRLTSAQGGEPVPIGVAEYMYNAMAALHWSGKIRVIEQECSDRLPIGCIFNTSDGDAEWATMNALVVRVTEDIDAGTTEVTFGPPLILGFQDLIEIIRANEGVRPSFQLSQRTDGQTATGANVTETKHAGGTSVSSAPGAPAAASEPYGFRVSIRTDPTNPSQWQMSVNPAGTLSTDYPTSTTLTVSGQGVWTYITSADTQVYLEGTVTSSLGTPTGTSAATIYIDNGTTFNDANTPWTTGAAVQNDGASPPNQTLWRIGLATLSWSAGKPSVTQRCLNNLIVRYTQVDYLPALYPGAP